MKVATPQRTIVELAASVQAKDFLDIEEAAFYLGFAKSTLVKYLSERRYPVHKPPQGGVYLKKSELFDILDDSRYRVISTYEA